MTNNPPAEELSPERIAFREKKLPNPEKRQFFEDLARKYGREMRLLFQGGKLTKEDGWRNVAEHCLMQVAAAEELCDILGLSSQEKEAVCSTSAIHDWKKRWEVTKKEIPSAADKVMQSIAINQDLMNATNPDHLEKVFLGEEPFTEIQELQLYLDLITRENDIVPSEDRICEVENAPRSKGLAEKANGQYWQKVREARDRVEQRLFEELTANKCAIAKREDIPVFLRKCIEENWKGGKN